MKKQIFYTLLAGLASMQTASAQELIEFPDSTVLPLERVVKISPSKLDDSGKTVSYTVNVTTEQGKDSTIYIDLPLQRSSEFNFWGGKGWVTNPLTWETTQEQNQDFYGWVESMDYGRVNVGALLSSQFMQSHVNLFDDAGYCISKSPNPTISDNVIKGYSEAIDYYNNTYNQQYKLLGKYCNLLDSFSDNETSCTLSCGINKYNGYFYNIIPFMNLYLENETTYYLRPYIVFNGTIMYGGELSFTTNSDFATITGELNRMKNEEVNPYYYSRYLDKSTCLAIDVQALLLGDKIKLTDSSWYGSVRGIVDEFLTADMLEQIRALSYSREYSDGTLYVASHIPGDIVSSFQEHLDSLLAAEYSFNLTCNDIVAPEEELYRSNEKVTKNVSGYRYMYFDPVWGIPDNSCVYIQNTGTMNPSIGIRIPQYLFPQTYDIYAVIVNPYVDTDPRANRFYTYIWEQDDKGLYPWAGYVRMVKEDGSYLSETRDSTLCDTVYLGSYTFNGNAEPIIQFVSNVISSQRSYYTYNMGISQIKFVPAKKENNE